MKYGTYTFNKFHNESLLVLDAYEKHKSIFKVASSVGVDKNVAMKWFIRGMNGDPKFRAYYLSINNINGFNSRTHEEFFGKLMKLKNCMTLKDLIMYGFTLHSWTVKKFP